MKISGIFEVVPESLFSVQFAGEPHHEFAKLFRLWNNAVFLDEFFETHYDDLLAFWEYMSAEDATQITREDAPVLERTILSIAERGVKGSVENLSTLFRPLHRGGSGVGNLEKSKARGVRRNSWLRVYAVRMDVNKFVISGGAIKLSRTMAERDHLLLELKKLEIVCDYLKEDQKNEFGFFELF